MSFLKTSIVALSLLAFTGSMASAATPSTHTKPAAHHVVKHTKVKSTKSHAKVHKASTKKK